MNCGQNCFHPIADLLRGQALQAWAACLAARFPSGERQHGSRTPFSGRSKAGVSPHGLRSDRQSQEKGHDPACRLAGLTHGRVGCLENAVYRPGWVAQWLSVTPTCQGSGVDPARVRVHTKLNQSPCRCVEQVDVSQINKRKFQVEFTAGRH